MKKFLLLIFSIGLCHVAVAQVYEYQNDFSVEPSNFVKPSTDTTYTLTLSNGALNIKMNHKMYMSTDSLFLQFPTPLDLTFNPRLTLTAHSDSNVVVFLYLVDNTGKELISSVDLKKGITDTTVVADFSGMIMEMGGFNLQKVTKVRFDFFNQSLYVLDGNFKLNALKVGGAMADSCNLLKIIKIGNDTLSDFNPYLISCGTDIIGTTLPTVVGIPFDSRATVSYESTNELGAQFVYIMVTPYTGAETKTYVLFFKQMARLSTLSVNGTAISGFTPKETYYHVDASKMSALPVVSATLVDPASYIDIQQATTLQGTATITVYSADSTAYNIYSVYFDKTDSIKTPQFPKYLYKVNSDVYVPVLTSYLSEIQGYMSYQFTFTYDANVLSYKGLDLTNSLSNGLTVTVDSTKSGVLLVSCSKGSAFVGAGNLITFKFKALQEGYSNIDIQNFMYNEVSVYNILTHTIEIASGTVIYGDVDKNTIVQAYDAAIVLQASVGINPYPSEPLSSVLLWMLSTADVDNDTLITANDASLILQYSAQLINIFPIEQKRAFVSDNLPKVEAVVDGRKLVIKSLTDIYGLNAFLPSIVKVVGNPSFASGMNAFNVTNDGVKVGLISAKPFEKGETLVRFDLASTNYSSFNIECNVNGVPQTLVVKKATSVDLVKDEKLKCYPNPVQNELTIEGSSLDDKTEIELLAADGQLRNVQFKQVNKKITLDTSTLVSGVYVVVLYSPTGEKSTLRFVKK
jgi:hypothetical protein